jgi:hypothetical protein
MLNRERRQLLASLANVLGNTTTGKVAQAAIMASAAIPKGRKAYAQIQNLVNPVQPAKAKSSLKAIDGGSTSVIGAPVSLGSTLRMTSAQRLIKSTGRGGQRVVHKELIDGAVVINSAYSAAAVTRYAINPGMSDIFPWLSTIAKQYEKYKVHRLRFIYVPYVASSTAGTAMMMVDYNVQDPVPTTETQFMDHPRSTTCSIWEPLAYSCSVRDIHSSSKELYIRSTNVAGDLKTFDAGRFFFLINNGSGSTCGKLYVEYDIELLIPQLGPATYLTPVGTGYFSSITAQTITKNIDTAITLPTATYAPWSLPVTVSNTTVTPPAGCYRVSMEINVTDDTAETCLYWAEFRLNGSPTPTFGPRSYATTTTAGGYQNLNLDAVIPFNGTDLLTIFVNFTGAAGVLQIVGKRLTFSLA